MAATLALGKALGAMCFIPGMSPRYAAASAGRNLRSSPSRLVVSERQSRRQCSRVRQCPKCVFPRSRNAWRSAESRGDSANSTSRAPDSLCQRNLDTPDVTVDAHAVRLERILCRALQHNSRAHVESRAVPWARHGDPSSGPSFNGPCLCVHLACMAQKPPSTLNTATSPTNTTDPGGTSLIRNSFSLSGAASIFMLHLHCARAS